MKRIIGVFAALALGLAIAACGGSDGGEGQGGTGGTEGTGGTGGIGGGGGECPALETNGSLSGSCLRDYGCTESRGEMAVASAASDRSTCESTGGTWSDAACPAAAGGACVQPLRDGWTTIYTWTDFSAAEVRAACDSMLCATYREP
jgi:hypothetical protein